MKPATTHVPHCEKEQAAVDQQQAAIDREGVAKSRGLSAEQRKHWKIVQLHS